MGSKVFSIIFLSLFFLLFLWQVSELTETRSLDLLNKKGELRVNLYVSSLRDTLEKHRHLPYVLSRDSRIISLLLNDIPSIRVSPHLEDFAHASGALIYVLDRGGTTVATSNWRSQQSLLGHNFSFRPYFTDARDGKPGGYYTVGLRTKQPGFFLSYPVRHLGEFLGVIVVKVDLEEMQDIWKKSNEIVIVSDSNGVIFLTSNREWKYLSLRSLPEKTTKRLQAIQYLNLPLSTLKMKRRSLKGHNIIELADNHYLEQALQLPEYGWRLHYLTNLTNIKDDVKRAVSLSTIVGFLVILTLLYLRERRQKRLSEEKAKRAHEVQQINEKLLREIAEHKKTEQDLGQTQKELIQAGKLAALGRMSAAIAHELNQPVTAIRTFVASSHIFLERNQADKVSENLDFISKLTERMGSITGQLKTFARKSKGKEEKIDLISTTEGVIRLFQPLIEKSGVLLHLETPAKKAYVTGDSLQVEQVLSNLIHNSLDAMKKVERKKLTIAISANQKDTQISLSDTGPGIAEEALQNLFDPFFTTKDIGEGLGLGLSISYGIVTEMGGTLSAQNLEDGGARFTITLPLLIDDQKGNE